MTIRTSRSYGTNPDAIVIRLEAPAGCLGSDYGELAGMPYHLVADEIADEAEPFLERAGLQRFDRTEDGVWRFVETPRVPRDRTVLIPVE